MKKKSYFNPKMLIYDFTLMGINAFIPVIGMVFTFCFLYFLCYKSGYDAAMYMTMSETVIPFVGSWWCYHLMRPIVEDNGGELYLTFPASRTYLGILRLLRMWIIYSVLIMIYCCGINIISGIDIVDLWFQLSMQSLFFLCFGFLCVVITKSPSYCWLISVAYSAFYLLTQNSHFKFFSIYTLSSKTIEATDFVVEYGFKVMLFSIVSLVVGQLIFCKK